MTCPYCKIVQDVPPPRNVVCINCRNYAQATQAQALAELERELFKTYPSLPHGWEKMPQYNAEMAARCNQVP